MCPVDSKIVRNMMRRSRSLIPILLIVLFLTVGLSQRASAYIDLGTGSYLMQFFLAGLFGMIFSAKSLWSKVREAFRESPDRESGR